VDTGISSFEGFAPEITIGAGNPEALKYGKLWAHPEYRKVAPGEQLAQIFLAQAHPKAGSEVLDFGCGTGRGALMLALLGGLRVTMLDFVNNCLDDDVRAMLTTQAHALRFIKADLEQKLPVAAPYGFCTDVLEHIPPDKVDRVLNNILLAAQHVFFSISTVEDRCGALIGEPLHLSLHPFAWWMEKFRERDCVIHWSQEVDGACLFYVSAWTAGPAIVEAGILNVTDEQIRANVQHNIAQGWQQVAPHPTNDVEVMLLGGGPSMPAFENEMKRQRAAGVKLITLNGAYNWALAHGLTPSAQIIVDARAFNARFVQPVVDGCKYLLSSQCDPSVFEGLPADRTYLWHTSTDLIKDLLNAQYEKWWYVPGGSTVLLRAIPLLRMLGFKRFHLYGCDSCLGEADQHHAYAQPENDSAVVVPLSVQAGRIFYCHPWMIAQAQEMLDLIRVLGEEIELEIHGDGLLAHILRTAAAEQAAADTKRHDPAALRHAAENH
jgi:SAM-dependent methyltransferase